MNMVTLKGITWDHPRGYDPLVAASSEYFKKKGVKIEWVKRSLKDFGDQSLEQLADKFDLLIIDHPHSGLAAESGCVLPLDQYLTVDSFDTIKSQSAGPSFESYNYKNHQWALPVDAAFQSACYRPDLLCSSAPSNWEQVFDLAKKIKKKGQYIGMALCPTDCLCTFLSLKAQLGSRSVEDGQLLIDHQVGVRVLALMQRFRDNFHPDSSQWNPIQLYDHMALYNDIIYTPLTFNYSNYSRPGFRKHILIFTNAPDKVSVLGGAGIAVSASCPYRAEAVDFAFWICDEGIQKSIYTINQGQPGNGNAWDDYDANILNNGFFKNTRATLNNAYVRPRYSGWPRFQEKLGDIIYEFLVCDKPVSKTVMLINELYLQSKIK